MYCLIFSITIYDNDDGDDAYHDDDDDDDDYEDDNDDDDDDDDCRCARLRTRRMNFAHPPPLLAGDREFPKYDHH